MGVAVGSDVGVAVGDCVGEDVGDGVGQNPPISSGGSFTSGFFKKPSSE